ncbi:hypothetical protein NPIL_289421 [Nephila pilipes]|uniref:Uncharacterized protein n=1 Tax=Nephila pilipes TaxID=299642 RepID=A0A8X6MQ05_NEPPI|nr:hypothetical protein NPIL_289421 [Nephila pilipes]
MTSHIPSLETLVNGLENGIVSALDGDMFSQRSLSSPVDSFSWYCQIYTTRSTVYPAHLSCFETARISPQRLCLESGRMQGRA